jgi:hypothetical protein
MAALPTTGISTSLVRSTIGAATNDVGTLCAHPNINKWSRWKPISVSQETGLTDAILKSNGFGLYFNSSSNINDILGIGTFTYNKPTGTQNSPFRIGDFRNYDHNAVMPIGTEITTTGVAWEIKKGNAMWNNQNFYTDFNVRVNPTSPTAIGYSDLYAISQTQNLYLGVHLTNGANKYWCTQGVTLQSQTGQYRLGVTVNWNDPAIKEWYGNCTVQMFVTNVKREMGQTYTASGSDIFITIPYDNENRNPYIVDLNNTYEYPFYTDFFVTSTHSVSGSTISYNFTFSSVGVVFLGGNVTNPTVVLCSYDSLGVYREEATNSISSSFTLSAEETVNKAYGHYFPNISGRYYFYKVIVNGKEYNSCSIENAPL